MFRAALLSALLLGIACASFVSAASNIRAMNADAMTNVVTVTNSTVVYELRTRTVTQAIVQAQSTPTFTNTVTFALEGWQAFTYSFIIVTTQYLTSETNASSTAGLNSFPQVVLSFFSPPVIVGVAAIIVAVILSRTQRRKKSLSGDLLSETALLRRQEELEGRLQIFFDSKPIKDAYLLVVKFVNDGNTPITQTDFEGPLYIRLGKEAHVLIADVSAKKRESLKPQILTEIGSISIKPLLLNPRDSFNLKAIVSQYEPKSFRIDGRIAGIEEIRRSTEGFWRGNFPLIAIVLLVFAMLGFVASVALTLNGPLQPVVWGVMAAVTVIAGRVLYDLYKLADSR
jgi:hypothetical protein